MYLKKKESRSLIRWIVYVTLVTFIFLLGATVCRLRYVCERVRELVRAVKRPLWISQENRIGQVREVRTGPKADISIVQAAGCQPSCWAEQYVQSIENSWLSTCTFPAPTLDPWPVSVWGQGTCHVPSGSGHLSSGWSCWKCRFQMWRARHSAQKTGSDNDILVIKQHMCVHIHRCIYNDTLHACQTPLPWKDVNLWEAALFSTFLLLSFRRIHPDHVFLLSPTHSKQAFHTPCVGERPAFRSRSKMSLTSISPVPVSTAGQLKQPLHFWILGDANRLPMRHKITPLHAQRRLKEMVGDSCGLFFFFLFKLLIFTKYFPSLGPLAIQFLLPEIFYFHYSFPQDSASDIFLK